MMPVDFRDTCTIMRRQATDVYGGAGADVYDVYKEDVSCYFVEREGRLERPGESGRNDIFTGVLMLDDEVVATDVIVIAEIEYSVLRVQPIRNYSGPLYYYRAYLQRSAAVDLESLKEEPVVNL